MLASAWAGSLKIAYSQDSAPAISASSQNEAGKFALLGFGWLPEAQVPIFIPFSFQGTSGIQLACFASKQCLKFKLLSIHVCL